MATHIGKSAQTNDISRLNGAAAEITKDAAIRHATADIEAEAAEERAAAIADWESRQKHAQVEKEEDEFDDDGFFDDDATVRDLESKRLAAMKARSHPWASLEPLVVKGTVRAIRVTFLTLLSLKVPLMAESLKTPMVQGANFTSSVWAPCKGCIFY